jgi:hypothetical protein
MDPGTFQHRDFLATTGMGATRRGRSGRVDRKILDDPAPALSLRHVDDRSALIGHRHLDGPAALPVKQNAGQSLEVAKHADALEFGSVVGARRPAALWAGAEARRA